MADDEGATDRPSSDVPPTAEVADPLFDLPPEEFVAARDALVKQLRADGERAAATAVKALRRPSLPAWALNQLARRHSPDLEDVLTRARAAASAQESALGGGDRASLRAALREHKEALQAAGRRIDEILGDRGARRTARRRCGRWALRRSTRRRPRCCARAG